MSEGIKAQLGDASIGVASSSVSILVEVERVQPVVNASGTALVSLIADWVAMQVLASLDPNANNVMMTDRATMIDVLALAIQRSDVSITGDVLLARVQKSLVDLAANGDTLRANIGKVLQDASDNSDAVALQVARQDVSAMLDALLANVQKALADASGAVDTLIANLSVARADAESASDAGTVYIQNYADNYAEAEYVGDKFTY